MEDEEVNIKKRSAKEIGEFNRQIATEKNKLLKVFEESDKNIKNPR